MTTSRVARRAERTSRRAAGYERDGLATVLLSVQRQAMADLRLRPSDRFLDVGCATGAAVRLAATRTRFAAGVDRSPVMIAHAQHLATGQPSAHFVVADAADLPFRPRSFTAILCTSVLHYLDDSTPAVRELLRVLDVDGRLVIAHPDDPARSEPGIGQAFSRVAATVTDARRMSTPIGIYTILVVRPPVRTVRAVPRPSGEPPATAWGCWRLPYPPV